MAMLRLTQNSCSLAILLTVIAFIVHTDAESDELKLVHVVFRHGERTPTPEAQRKMYPNDPYANWTFFPDGNGNLINSGKLTMYNFGTFLRRRYDKFLGDVYYPEVTRIRSIKTSRSIMSAQLVNAGLWPPSRAQQWHANLLWIPIPYEYTENNIDGLLKSYDCPTYQAEYKRVLQTEDVQALIEPHREFFAHLSKQTGKTVRTVLDVFFIYHTLKAQTDCNLTLPTWTKEYFPDGQMYNVTLLQYEVASWGESIKKIYGGPLLHDILQDYKKFANVTSPGKPIPKLTLYSGSESNIASILQAFGLWTSHIPDFGDAIIFELYLNNSTNEFGIQILHAFGKSEVTVPLTLPGCTQICPINNFTNLLSNVVPDNIEEVCGIKKEFRNCQSSSDSLRSTLNTALLALISLKLV